jgi:hypothetical protein
VRFLLICLLLLVAGPAHAQVLSATDAAIAADAAHSEHCAGVKARGDTEAAALNEAVSGVWGAVSLAWDEHQVPYLRYWRGVLTQCLGHEERAVEDFIGFYRVAQDDKDSVALVNDVRKRLRRLGVKLESKASVNIGAVPLVVGILAAAVGGPLHAASYAQAELVQTDSGLASTLTRDEYDSIVQGQDVANKAGFGLLVGGAVSAVLGAVAVGIDARNKGGPRATAVVVPTRGGVVVAIGGRF